MLHKSSWDISMAKSVPLGMIMSIPCDLLYHYFSDHHHWSRINHPHLGPTRNHSEGWLERSFNEALGALRPDAILIPLLLYILPCAPMQTHKRHQKTEWHVYVQIICLPKKNCKKKHNIYIYTNKKNLRRHLKFGHAHLPPIFRSKMHRATFRDLLPSGPRAQREFPKRRTVGKAFNLRYHLISFDIMWLLGGISITMIEI